MSIDAKRFPVLIWKVLRFSMLNFYKCVKKYPIPSGVLFLSFLLYLFLPFLFLILIFSSPILIGIGVLIRFRLNRNAKDLEKKNRDKSKSDAGQGSPNPSFRSQKSVRRNVRKENSELDAHGNIITLTNPLDEILGRNKEKHTIVRNRKGKSKKLDDYDDDVAVSESSSDSGRGNNGFNEQLGKSLSSVEGEIESMEDAEEEDEEEVQEDRNKAVEWTEDDQKNLMDLGESDLERNKRLESLIARRRARKLFRMAVEKSLMDMDSSVPPGQVAPIFVARGAAFDDFKAPEQDGFLHMPGSAPSILLPGRNPFDLPYDPQEEKPNLTGDSFQQEFMAAHQKDMFFSRHESFCRGPFFTFDAKDPQFGFGFGTQEKMVERPKFPTFEKQSDKGGTSENPVPSNAGSAADLINLDDSEDLPRVEIEEKSEPEQSSVNESEVQTEIDSVDDKLSSSSTSSSETNERLLNRKKFPEVLSYHVQKLVHATPPRSPSMDKPPLISITSPTEHHERPKLDHHSFFKAPLHTPSNSIASDLQVEVSEVGSPRHCVDDDLIHYDADTDKGISSDNDERWDCSFYHERREEKGTESEKVHKASEEHAFNEITNKEHDPVSSGWCYDQSIMAYEKILEKNKEFGEIVGKASENDITGSIPEEVRDENTSVSVQDGGNEQDVQGVIDGHVASSIPPRFGVEQDSASSNTFASPRTVLLPETPKDQNEEQVSVNSVELSPIEKLEEQYDMTQNSSKESDNTSNQMNESHLEHKEGKKDSLIKPTESDSDTTSINHRNAEELSQPAKGSKTQDIMRTEAKAENADSNPTEATLKKEISASEIVHKPDRGEPTTEPQKDNEESKSKSQRLDEDEGNNATPSKPMGKSDSSSGIKIIEELKELIGEEGGKSTPKLDEKVIEGSLDKPPGLLEVKQTTESVKSETKDIEKDTKEQSDMTKNSVKESNSTPSQMNEPQIEHKEQSDMTKNSVKESNSTPCQMNEPQIEHKEQSDMTKNSVKESNSTPCQMNEPQIEHKEQSDMTKNSVKESNSTPSQMNEPQIEHKEGTKDSLIKSTERDSETVSISHTDAEELSRPTEESNPPNVTLTEVKAENITKVDASSSKSEKENGNSNVTEATSKKEVSAPDRGEPAVEPLKNNDESKLKSQLLVEEEGNNATSSKATGESDSSSGTKVIEEHKELIGEEGAKNTPKVAEKVPENSQDKPPSLLEGNPPFEPVKSETKDVKKETENGNVVAG